MLKQKTTVQRHDYLHDFGQQLLDPAHSLLTCHTESLSQYVDTVWGLRLVSFPNSLVKSPEGRLNSL